MPNKKISQLNINTTPDGSDVIPIVNSGETKQISLSGLTEFISDNIITGGSYPKELISGGASWSGTGYTYNVTSLTYQFYGPVETTSATSVTLSSGDTTYDRIDAIVIDEFGVVQVIEGTPSPSPATPNISEYLLVQYVIVPAGSTAPAETIENIYLENVEWVGSILNVPSQSPNGTINFTGTTSPYAGTYDIEVNANVGRRVKLTSNYGAYQANEFQLMTLWVKFPVALATSRIFYLWLYNGSTVVGTVQNLFTLGLNRTLVNTWQQVIVPMSAFAAGSLSFDNIVMTIGGGTNVPLQYSIDNIKLSAGVVLPPAEDVNINIQYSGTSIGQYPTINFIPGNNVTLNVTGNTLNNRVDVTINSVGGGSGTDVYVTGGTYSNGTAVFTNTTGGTFSVSGFSTGGTVDTYNRGWQVEKENGNTLNIGKGVGKLFLINGSNEIIGVDGVDFTNDINFDSPFYYYEATVILPNGDRRYISLDSYTSSTGGTISEIYSGNNYNNLINTIWDGPTGEYDYYPYFISEANGELSHAEGAYSMAIGLYSHAEGQSTTAIGSISHTQGYNTIAVGSQSHAEGSGTIASGDTSHAEGASTTAIGLYSHAEGSGTIASGDTSHAEGVNTIASGSISHAEGFRTIASGFNSHSEGYGTTASGDGSHAEGGYFNSNVSLIRVGGIASGISSHAGGQESIASGRTSFVHGSGSTAGGTSTVVFGNGITGITDNTVYVPDLVIKKSASVPTSSIDVIGEDGSVTWDNNYFYWKANGQWLRVSGITF